MSSPANVRRLQRLLPDLPPLARVMALGIALWSPAAAEPADAIAAARGVLARTTAGTIHDVRFDIIPSGGGGDAYTFEAHGGILTITGSGTVALCRGFYDYARKNRLGMVSWVEGKHLTIPAEWPDTPLTRRVTPFEIRHAYNAVTPGYTTPYWTWQRWERELDWQAMHGFNMLMAPVATEAIAERVWLNLGLTQTEIDATTCGPAHLPWYRMGNICGIDGHLPKAWHADQIALQHQILNRMRELGIEPVVQSFAGFVPRAITRLQPQIQLHGTAWNGALPAANRPVLILPDEPLFAKLTAAHLAEWHREFGRATYFLIDSFNEMEVPKTARPVTEVLADYGEKTWQAIHAADPSAVWVLQGWTFGYQNWRPENLAALFSKVPDDRLLVLDYANDYFPTWEKYQAFYGKTWVFGYVPNMGGKTPFTGNLDLYATASAKVLHAPARGKLKGFTLSGEGLENNEALYELLTDAAWSAAPIPLDEWFASYSANRYGACPPAIAESWQLLRKSCYSHLIDHPKFAWQRGNGIPDGATFLKSTELFLSVSGELGNSPLYRADAIERSALALGYTADAWYQLAKQAHGVGDTAVFEQAAARTLEWLTLLDRLLESHPYHRLQRWLDFARAHGDTPELKQAYEANARCLVSYWTNGVQNYSSRVWSGLVRDYYREWVCREFDALQHGTPFDANAFMIAFSKGSGISPVTPSTDPLRDAKMWLKQAMDEPLPVVRKPDLGGAEPIARWSPDQLTTDWQTREWSIPAAKLATLDAVVFTYTGGNHRLEIQEVAVVADGRVVATDRHFGYAGKPDSRPIYQLKMPVGTTANNGCLIRAIIKGGGGTDSKGTVALITRKP